MPDSTLLKSTHQRPVESVDVVSLDFFFIMTGKSFLFEFSKFNNKY